MTIGTIAQDDLWGGEQEIQTKAGTKSLAERFIVPPFSVLDARQGYWQERKRAWLRLGIKGELGRGSRASSLPIKKNGELIIDAYRGRRGSYSETTSESGISIFDPVLCELAYQWFCPPKGKILDPFAGGSVRGIVADRLGKRYIGIDLLAQQLQANESQADEILGENRLMWILGDSRNLDELIGWEQFDFVFTCPPYYDLEIYSEDERDLSLAPTYQEFLEGYEEIITGALALLKSNRFACFVVANIRDKQGHYRNLVGDTVRRFEKQGAKFYNEAILINIVGSLPIRTTRMFEAGRKLGKTHQNVLVFVKGDWRKATAACKRT